MRGESSGFESQVAWLTQELDAARAQLVEAQLQKAATDEVLRAISQSTADVQPVFNAIVESAARLCGAQYCFLDRFDGKLLHFVAGYGLTPEALAAIDESFPMSPGPGSTAARAIEGRTVVQIPDLRHPTPGYTGRAIVDALQVQSAVAVPMLKDGIPIGVLTLDRTEAGYFPEHQVEFLKTFADQAVIAFENVRLFEEVQARNREVSEALEQQTATAAILGVIAGSPTNLQPVLNAVVETATRLCEAYDAAILLKEGDSLAVGAHFGPIPIDIATMPLTRNWVSARSVIDRTMVQVPDLASAGDEFAAGRASARSQGHRTTLAMPLLHEGEAIGTIVMRRTEVRPFSEKQVGLLKTFADQAVIAIQNVRWFEEVQARNREVSEALEQQTATGAILRAIAASPTDIRPVLDVVVESATRFCDTDDAAIFLERNGMLEMKAHFGPIPLDLSPLPIARDWVTGRCFVDRQTVFVDDLQTSGDEFPLGRQLAEQSGHRTLVATPLLRDEQPIGVLVIRRTEVRPFSDKQIRLMKTFADQAAIAIQNVRLFEEVQARTADLTEALDQQTATADVLKVISRSAFGLQSVLQTLIDSAVRLCASDGVIYLRRGDVFVAEAAFEVDRAHWKVSSRTPRKIDRSSVTGRVALSGQIEQIPDNLADPEFAVPVEQRLRHIRALVGVPLLRDGLVEGVFVLGRPEPGLFTPRQIEMVQTFADQAVIAIENVRLFTELGEALQQQTATADVLKVISRSAFDLQTVLETLVQSVSRLCNAGHGLVFRRYGDVYRFAAGYVLNPEFEKIERELEVLPGRETAIGRAVLTRQVIQIVDAMSDPEYEREDLATAGNLRTVLGVPLLLAGEPIGAFGLSRDWVEPFSDREVELVRTFADQAVIAIENARLFEQVQAKTRDLEESLRDLRTAQDRLVQTEKLASLGQLTAGIAHEIKNPLNFVNNFAALSGDLLGDLEDALDRAALAGPLRAEFDELTGLLKGNLAKVEQHGKRADSIVKNMLLHSRQGSGEHRPTNINAVVEESLNLAYHGARAERQGFNITLERDLDPGAGEVDLYPQEIARVLLNLISNGFYATTKRRMRSDAAYEPVLMASTKDLGDHVEIRIRDNGTGISPEVLGKMFTPFFTTKPAGEGTGLGLSISHDIVVKQHAGTIDIDTRSGEFTEVRIVLPRGGASLGRGGDA